MSDPEGDAADRAVCVHGHFYQPPRENPWSGRIDPEPTAAPWDDWNHRITDECYEPNTAAEIHGARGVSRRNNFASIGFDVGPTLMTWLAAERPDVHAEIVAADGAGAAARGDRGGAIAHPFDHLILPLASPRDRRTQIRWGLADFRRRYGRDAAGMWLPETAVDLATLDDLAAEGVGFVILAPRQAARVRPRGGAWSDAAAGDGLVSGRAYAQRLPSGREITLLFYDGALAHDIAFGGLLHDGEALARRLESAASPAAGNGPRLALVATDGESYGHHHTHGEMALAEALERIDAGGRTRITTCEAWIERHPPDHEVEIAERTSWSCAHGLLRWSGGCDCGPGGEEADYRWRGALWRALQELRRELVHRFENGAGELLLDPHEALDARPPGRAVGRGRAREDARDAWWAQRLRPGADRAAARRWLDAEGHAMRMFTSCGWFFEDPVRLETRLVLRHAARALELSGAVGPAGSGPGGDPVVDRLLTGLSNVRSASAEGWNAADELRRILREDR